jgi:hypothetical protein
MEFFHDDGQYMKLRSRVRGTYYLHGSTPTRTGTASP